MKCAVCGELADHINCAYDGGPEYHICRTCNLGRIEAMDEAANEAAVEWERGNVRKLPSVSPGKEESVD